METTVKVIQTVEMSFDEAIGTMMTNSNKFSVQPLDEKAIESIVQFADMIKSKNTSYLQVLQYFHNHKEEFDTIKTFFDTTTFKSAMPAKKIIEIGHKEPKNKFIWADDVSDAEKEENEEPNVHQWTEVVKKHCPPVTNQTTMQIIPLQSWAMIRKEIVFLKPKIINHLNTKFEDVVDGDVINQAFDGGDAASIKSRMCRFDKCMNGTACYYAHDADEQFWIGYNGIIFKILQNMVSQNKVKNLPVAYLLNYFTQLIK